MNDRDGSTLFGLDDAANMGAAAESRGFVRDGFAFANWMLDTYRDETLDYMESLSLTTLAGRWAESLNPTTIQPQAYIVRV